MMKSYLRGEKAPLKEPIAIIGMSCRLPGAPSPDAFWRLIEDGRNAIGPVPTTRWRLSDSFYNDPDFMQAAHAWHGGFLDEDVTGIDWKALYLNPREARAMDPQHRLLLELAWEALENAGIPVEKQNVRSMEKTGVFVGLQWNDYFRLLCREWKKLDGYAVTGNDLLFASNRISFTFNLPGPSQSIDSGCASGLVALQQGCQALWADEADQVLVGAVDLILAPDSQLAMAATGMLSKCGSCKPLDAEADGFVRGEGGVVIALKRLSKVTRKERVHALIRGVDALHSGRTDWIMAASGATQKKAVQGACRQASVDPSSLNYVELHGTGSQRGDPVEIKALAETVGLGRSAGAPCAIGSVKAQIGHLGPVAGLAGLLKVVLGMQHGRYPRSWQPEIENPGLGLSEAGLSPYRGGEDWTRENNMPRRAGVTALSLGGVAAHALVEEAPTVVQSCEETKTFMLPVSARSLEALYALAEAWAVAIEAENKPEVLADLCFTAGCGRAHHEYRLAALGRNGEEIARDIRQQVKTLKMTSPTFSKGTKPIVTGWSLDANVVNECETAGLEVRTPDEVSDTDAPVLVLAGPKDATRVRKLKQNCATAEVFEWPANDDSTLPLTFWAASYRHNARPDFSTMTTSGCICTAPHYPWQRQRMWPQWLTPECVGMPPLGEVAQPDESAHPILGKKINLAESLGLTIWQTPSTALPRNDETLAMTRIVEAVAESTGIKKETIDAPVALTTAGLNDSQAVQIVLRSGDLQEERPALEFYQDGVSVGWSQRRPSVAPHVDRGISLAKALTVVTPQEQLPLLADYVRDLLLEVLQPETGRTIAEHDRLTDLGLDSIAAAEIRTHVMQEFSIDLPFSAIFKCQTVGQMSDEISRRYQAENMLRGMVKTIKAPTVSETKLGELETWTL